MIPPQVRPTLKAVSSLTPYRWSTGWPLAITSPVSSYTAPSTHPPDTLPTTSPLVETASAAPGSLGALLNVLTTVAKPNSSPASHHLTIWSRMSRTAGHPLSARNSAYVGPERSSEPRQPAELPASGAPGQPLPHAEEGEEHAAQ